MVENLGVPEENENEPSLVSKKIRWVLCIQNTTRAEVIFG